MMVAVDAVLARRLARSILEARREGRALTPITNTHLLTRADALKIQDALLDLRIGQGESLIGWYLEKSGEVAPLTDRMILPAQPVGLIAPQRVEGVAIGEDGVQSVTLIIDRVIKGGLPEDFLAHGCGLVGVILGTPIAHDTGDIRDEAGKALKRRHRELRAGDLVIHAFR